MATKFQGHQNQPHVPPKVNNIMPTLPLSSSLQQKLSKLHEMEARPAEPPLPNLPDLMNDWFVGAVNADLRNVYKLKGGREGGNNRVEKNSNRGGRLPPPPPSSASRMTQEWLEEANRMVAAATPSSCYASPARSAGPTRFMAAQARDTPLQPPPLLERRDALARSARRNRSKVGIGGEILQRSSARHNRNRSDFPLATDCNSPAPGQHAAYSLDDSDACHSPTRRLPPKFPSQPKSRFLTKCPETPPRRTFRSPSPVSRLPPPFPLEIDHQQPPPLSPPRNLLESPHRWSISTCYADKESLTRRSVSGRWKSAVEVERLEDVKNINCFLRRQRKMIARASHGELSTKAKIVLSSYTPNTSSMVAAICYAWLLENTMEKEESCIKDEVVVPVINMKRTRMWEHKQAAWLFHYIGIDASALIFSDELDLEGLLMGGKQLSLLVVGQDVLQANGKVGSLCTILTDNYCEDAYDFLQTPCLKKLLLAGILLDTQNLSRAAKPFTNRDVEAVQLLMVGFSPDFRDFFYEQVMKVHDEDSFLEALRQHYGKLSIEDKLKPSAAPATGRAPVETTSVLPIVPFKATEKSSRPKSKFSIGRLLGFALK